MALQLSTPRIAVNEFELHVFELAFVLSLMRVESVAALPDAVLFPQDVKLRKKVLAEGEKRLLANGWHAPNAQPGSAEVNEDLLSLIAALADPAFTILTRRQTAEGQRSDATIHLNNVEIVEVTQTDRQVFRLRRLKDARSAFQQVRKMLGVTPLHKHADFKTELAIEAFEQVRQYVAAEEQHSAVATLVEAGVSPAAADDLIAALATPSRKGVVSVLKHEAQKVTDVRVMGFYLHDGATWITSVAGDSTRRVLLEAVDTDGFICRLVDRVASLGLS